jgi:predicted kinase
MSKLIVIAGLPATGKSTLAEGLARQLALPLFSVDPIESAIIKSGIGRSFETGLAAYRVAESLAGEHLKLGLSVIIDAVSPVKEARDMWHQLAREYRAELIIIECRLDAHIHKKRVEDRVRNLHGIPEVTWEDIEQRRAEYLPWQEEVLIVDTANAIQDNLAKVLNHIHATHHKKQTKA